MPTLNWVETLPSDGSAVGRSPAEIRQPMTNVALGLGTQLEWPGSGGGSELSAGQPKAGAARPYFAASSAKSLAAPQQLFLTSDTTRLYFMTSAGTVLAGTMYLMEHQTAPSTGRWVFQSGTTVLADDTPYVKIDFPWPYAEAPTVVTTSSFVGVSFAVRSASSQSFMADARRFGGSDDTTLNWLAIGKVAWL